LKKDGKLEERIEWKLDLVDRAVIMISPFPELKPIQPAGHPAPDIVSIVSALVPSLIDQVRFKPTELVLAADPNHGSRYLIGPSRTIELSPGTEKEERYAIASGLLGGFGGLVAHAFRDHDFQLGRRNCQRFLQATFALPPGNHLFDDWRPNVANPERFKAIESKYDKGETTWILPLFGSAADEVILPKWPQISEGDLKTLLDRIGGRFDKVAPALVDQKVSGVMWGMLRFALTPIEGLIRARLLKYVRLAILTDLVRRNQIQGWDLGNLPAATGLDEDDVRSILAELIDPAYDQRNVAGLLKAAIGARPAGSSPAGITADKILNLLERCKAATGRPYQVWQAPWNDKDRNALFTLVSRAPNVVERLITRTGVAFRPTVDPPGF
jgi:hypothetical protein